MRSGHSSGSWRSQTVGRRSPTPEARVPGEMTSLSFKFYSLAEILEGGPDYFLHYILQDFLTPQDNINNMLRKRNSSAI